MRRTALFLLIGVISFCFPNRALSSSEEDYEEESEEDSEELLEDQEILDCIRISLCDTRSYYPQKIRGCMKRIPRDDMGKIRAAIVMEVNNEKINSNDPDNIADGVCELPEQERIDSINVFGRKLVEQFTAACSSEDKSDCKLLLKIIECFIPIAEEAAKEGLCGKNAAKE